MTGISPSLSTTQRRVQQHFQRGFRNYNDHAHVQAHIATHLAELFVQAVGTHRFHRALEIGCGTGFLTQELVSRISVDHWTLNDLVSDCKTQIAPILSASNSTWDFLSGAIEAVPLPIKYDLIVSASTIQWVADTPALLKRLSDRLTPGGWLVLSSFAPDHFCELEAFGAGARKMSYFDSSDWHDLLPDNLVPKYIGQDVQTAKFASVRDMLVHLRNTGVNANAQHNWSRQNLAAFELDYASEFSDQDQKVQLTYAPVYIIAQKSETPQF